MKKIFLILFLANFFSACSNLPYNSPQLKSTAIYSLKNAPVIGQTFSGQKIKTGGFQSIHFFEKRDNEFLFYAVANRGPTSKTTNNELVFLLPDLNPRITTLKTDQNNQAIEVDKELLLSSGQQKTTGLPVNRKEENPVDVFGLFYSIDPNGLDFSAIISNGEEGYWLADQYAPALVHINQDGFMTQKLVANAGLPRMYANKIPLRGFSALAKIDSRLFAFIPDFEKQELVRILEASADNMRTTAEYFYQIDAPENHITAATAIDSNTILVLEKSSDETFRKIFLIEINNSEELVKKHMLLDLNLTPMKKISDITALAVVDEKTLALMTDNNFQIDGYTDLKTGLTPLNEKISQLIIVEFEKTIIK